VTESERVALRPEILSLASYRQGTAAASDAFKLSSNENPFDPIPEVLDAITAASINRYPDGSAGAVRLRLAARYGVPVEAVHVGAGSVALIAQLIQAAAGPGDEVVYAWRSFEAYPSLVTVAGATRVEVPIDPVDGTHDLEAMAAAITARTHVVIVCTPNNPTGTIVTEAEFARFMEAVPPTVLVLLDEAYAEFVTDPAAVTGIPSLGSYPNLVVLRTFSKAYGLAGLRFGYAIGSPYILDAARATAIPLSVIEQAQRAAIAALDHEDMLMERVARLTVLRDRVWNALCELGFDVPQPQGNFVWLATGEHTAEAAAVFLRHGVVVRALGDDGLRITIGEVQSVDRLLTAAEEVLRTWPTPEPAARLD
jgi:histidinol-phosphate aminotransferase